MFGRFTRTPTCDRHRHRQTDTDRQTHGHSIYRASIASRGKNESELNRPDGELWCQVNSYTNNDVAVYKEYINLRTYLQIILKFVDKSILAGLLTDIFIATN